MQEPRPPIRRSAVGETCGGGEGGVEGRVVVKMVAMKAEVVKAVVVKAVVVKAVVVKAVVTTVDNGGSEVWRC